MSGDAPGGRTPEELATLLEDALLLGDPAAAAALVVDGGVLVDGAAHTLARGPGRVAAALCGHGPASPAPPAADRRVVQARDVALLAGCVARRGADGTWRYAILVDDRR